MADPPCWVQVTWVQPRVLTQPQVKGLGERLDAWCTKVFQGLDLMEGAGEEL